MIRRTAHSLILLLPLLAVACNDQRKPELTTVTPRTEPAVIGGIRFNPGGPDLARYTNAAREYPRATTTTWWQPAYSVDAFSRIDSIFSAHVVARPPLAQPWKRVAGEPQVIYQGAPQIGADRLRVDDYMVRNPTTGLLVAVDDTIQIERYQYGRTDSHRLISFSMAKTICALLVGLAVSDGAIASIEDAAEKYVPALKGSEYGRTPIRHLLTMSSGVKFREDYDGQDDSARLSSAILYGPGGPSAVRQFNTRDAEPGARWYYASAETQVLGLVLRGALKRPLAEYLSDRIWKPMGAEADASWIVDRTGQENTSSNFSAVLRDYARLGMLLARGGRMPDGRQLIPADWLRDMTRPHFNGAQTGRWFGYGFQTWIFPDNDGSFAFLGVRGQAIYVDPARRLVMVHTAVRPDARDPRGADATALWRGLRQHFPRRAG